MAEYNLKDDYDYFNEHKDELVKQYSDKFIVIKDKNIIGVYDDQVSAYTETTKDHALGTFLIQKCSNEPTETQVFRSRVLTI